MAKINEHEYQKDLTDSFMSCLESLNVYLTYDNNTPRMSEEEKRRNREHLQRRLNDPKFKEQLRQTQERRKNRNCH